MDRKWWDNYAKELIGFDGVKYTPLMGIKGTKRVDSMKTQNSGAGAIAVAAGLGAARIILLGYDCQHTGGKAHWHADHPAGMGNAGSVAKWPAQFESLKKKLSGVDIVNCTRSTALDCFRRAPLEDELCLQ